MLDLHILEDGAGAKYGGIGGCGSDYLFREVNPRVRRAR